MRPPQSLTAVLPSPPLSIAPQTLTSMRGYLNNEAATRDYFTEDGFACMGDLGYYDQEGKLYFKDRIKEVIKVSVDCPGPLTVTEHDVCLLIVYATPQHSDILAHLGSCCKRAALSMCVYIVEHFLLSIYYKVTAKWFGPSEVEECIELIDGVAEACVWVGSFLQIYYC